MKKLDTYYDFINRHVLNPMGVDLYDLFNRGLAIDFEEWNK